jgi:hypothetical protein
MQMSGIPFGTVLKAGMRYQMADKAGPHRSSTESGAKLFIVD